MPRNKMVTLRVFGVQLFLFFNQLLPNSLSTLHLHTAQVLLAVLLLHQAVCAEEATVLSNQSPNIVKATIEVTQA